MTQHYDPQENAETQQPPMHIRPSRAMLEEQPAGANRVQHAATINYEAEDLKFFRTMYTACLAETAAKGGNTAYAAQSCAVVARQALGMMVIMGIIQPETMLEDGTTLWQAPTIPPMGQAPQRPGF